MGIECGADWNCDNKMCPARSSRLKPEDCPAPVEVNRKDHLATKADLARLRSEVAARDKTIAALEARVRELEARLKDMHRMYNMNYEG